MTANKSFIIFIFITLVMFGCKKEDVIDDLEPGIIENKTFNSTVLIDGHTYDGTLIRNCIFESIDGDGLQIRDVDNLCIENCTFRNISENAIRFRNSGSSNGVKIIENEINNIEKNGILAPENHINSIIRGNTIYNVATNNTSSGLGAPHHGIYFQGNNVTITENTIHDILNNQGNCISIRTYGVISKNKLYNATDHGISYYSDHPGNGQELKIENNIIYDNGKRAINLASNGESENHIGNALIRFNSTLSNDESPIGINDDLTNVNFNIYGNILIRTDGGSTYIFSSLPYSQSYNIMDSGDIGFIDFNNRNLHILNSSSATNAADGITSFPTIDIDGDTRNSSNIDIGADEI
jgi:hypothetical protein